MWRSRGNKTSPDEDNPLIKWDFLLPIIPHFAYCKPHADFLARTAKEAGGATRTLSIRLHQTLISSSEETRLREAFLHSKATIQMIWYSPDSPYPTKLYYESLNWTFRGLRKLLDNIVSCCEKQTRNFSIEKFCAWLLSLFIRSCKVLEHLMARRDWVFQFNSAL